LFPGCGVFTAKSFAATDFLLEYRGELISADIAEDRFRLVSTAGSFFYFFESYGRNKMW
jgi:hypothetical protein